jgi:hypothetical protein
LFPGKVLVRFSLAKHGGGNQAIDTVSYQGLFPGKVLVRLSLASFLAEHGGCKLVSRFSLVPYLSLHINLSTFS